jgi:hypothetical protein
MNQSNPNSNQFLTRRAQMAFVGIGMWLLLFFWTISAFWQHLDQLQPSYATMAKCGAVAGEFALLALVLWHCFDKHLGVRRWSLIFAFLLAGVLLSHGGALRGLHESATLQRETEQRMAEAMAKMTREQQAGIQASAGGTQRERLAKERQAKNAQAEIAKNAQAEVAKNIAAADDKIKESSIFPRWYLDGWMYSVIFILALGFVSIIGLLMMRGDVDADFDGILDRDQEMAPRRIRPLSPQPVEGRSDRDPKS